MDAILIQNIFTVASALAFVVIVAWAWSARAKAGFAAAERLPFEEDLPAGEEVRTTK